MTTTRLTKLTDEQSDFARSRAAAKAACAAQNAMAARTVAANSIDRSDCESLLAMLGVEAHDNTEG